MSVINYRKFRGRTHIYWKCVVPGFMFKQKFILISLALFLSFTLFPRIASTEIKTPGMPANFGLPGLIDLPTARRFPDGELIFTHQNHEYLFMNGIAFQALPRLGFAFRYGGQGRGGSFAQGRVNWDRSFDAHISLIDEGKYYPAISIGFRDFIGTGWYSSEYIVGTKSFRKLELTAGLGFGRLAGRDTFSNPLGVFSSRFDERAGNIVGRGGTLGTINGSRAMQLTFMVFATNLEIKLRF